MMELFSAVWNVLQVSLVWGLFMNLNERGNVIFKILGVHPPELEAQGTPGESQGTNFFRQKMSWIILNLSCFIHFVSLLGKNC